MSKHLKNHHSDTGTFLSDQSVAPTAQNNSVAPVFADAETLLSLILSNSEDIFLLVDKDLKIQLYNDVAARMSQLYFNRPIKKGDSILDFAEPCRAGVLTKIYTDVFNGASCKTDIEFNWNGTHKIFQNAFSPVKKKNGAIVAALISVHDVTEERKTKNALIESEERLRFALEGSNHGIWDWNIETGEIFFSPSWKKMLGFEEGEIENSIQEWEARIHPEDKEQIKRDLQTHYESDEPTYENSYRLRAKDGNYRWVMGRGKIVARAPDGTPLRMIGTHTDITEKRVSEEQYRNLFDANPLPSWIYDFETLQFLTVNKAAISHYGYTKEAFSGMTIFDVHLPESFPLLQQRIDNRDKENDNQYPNWKHKKKNGELFIADVKGTTIQYKGRKARLIVVNDITEKVAAAEELRKSNQRFQYVSKATSDAIYDWDIPDNQLNWNEVVTKLFGYEPAQITIDKWERLIHPDEQKQVIENLTETLYKTRKKLWRMEYRFLKSDGTYSFVIEKGFILRDAENKPLRMIGALQDITNIKEKQLELIESNNRYEYATLAISDIIWDWNLKTNTVLWSDNYEKIMGWELPENKCLKFEACLEKIHQEDKARVIESLQTALLDSSQNLWFAEFIYLKPSNDIAHVCDRGYIIRDEAGKAIRMIGAMQDITHRKKLEAQLLQKELEKQKVISKATIDTQERERSEIGKELHDNVNQVLTTTKLYLELALTNPELKDDLLQKSKKNIMYVINEIRQLSCSLMNPSLGDLGLIDSVSDLVENIRATRKLNVVFKALRTIEAGLPDSLKLTIYRIIQEALNNTVKHAQATAVSIFIRKKAQTIELIVQDNGIGFNPEETKKGAGLKSIKNRVYLNSGSLAIKSRPGAGCTLNIHFNLQNTNLQ